jgi:hypothetical protein
MDGTIHTTPKGRRLTGYARESLIRHGFQEPLDTVDAIIEHTTHVKRRLMAR